jgi:DNA-binding MarR family transcriptional regulator
MTQMQDTSLEAYRTVNLSKRESEVLDIFYENPGVKDWSNAEIAMKLKWAINRVTGRVHDLREKGVLEYTRTRPCEVTGYDIMAWRVKEASK